MMAAHRYKVGQTLNFHPMRMGSPAAPRECKILRLLPVEGGTIQYRIKCDSEPFERVAKESELAPRTRE
jgi:hypothetical protein